MQTEDTDAKDVNANANVKHALFMEEINLFYSSLRHSPAAAAAAAARL